LSSRGLADIGPAMIPYVHIPALEIAGPLKIQPFGVLVVAAVATGSWMTRRRARQAGGSDEIAIASLYWCVGTAFVMSHVVEILFYQTHKLIDEGPLTLLKVWDGLSSMGGFFGALLGLWIYFTYVEKRSRWIDYAEYIMQGLAFGWIFGRMGCTVVHDHPGRFSDFFLAVKYPEGARYDLGLYEMLYVATIIFPATLILHHLKPPKGSFIAAVCLLYAPVRFGFDFLRIESASGADPRYFGLTAGHYGALAILLIGLYFVYYAYRHKDDRHLIVDAAELAALDAAAAQAGKGGGKARRKGKKKGGRAKAS